VPAPAAEEVGVNKYQLSAKEIKWILAQKPWPPPARYQALKRSNPELTPRPGEEHDETKKRLYFLARAFYDLEERFAKAAGSGAQRAEGEGLRRG
jgi:hypothetical protein